MKTAKDLYPIVQKVGELFEAKDYKAVDVLLVNIDFRRHIAELVTLVRTTYPAREKLEYWEEAVSRVASELERRGVNSSRVLRGLLKA